MGVLFGKNARKILNYGDIAVSLQYVGEEEACVLYPLRRTRDVAREHKPGAYVIPLSSTWKYANEAYCVKQSIVAAEVMGFGGMDRSAAKKIRKIFNDAIIELLQMKPLPMDMQRAARVDDIKIDGRKVRIEVSA